MPIRQLDYVLQDKGLIRDAPLSALEGTRLGIDAGVYVRRLLTAPETKEAFVAALGGVPLALEEHIVSDMRLLERMHIKPIFVFAGLRPQSRHAVPSGQRQGPGQGQGQGQTPLIQEDTRPAKRAAAWEHYEKNRNEQAVQAFGQTPLGVADVLRVVHRCFLHRKTEFVVAPYLEWAQLAYLERHPKPYTHATWSSTEFLLFEGVDKLILNVDFKAQTFTFVSKRDLLKELALTPEQFLDLGILAGFSQVSSIPLPDWSFKAVLDLIKQFGTGIAAVGNLSNPASPESPNLREINYLDSYLRTKAMIRYSLVLASIDSKGKVLPLPLALPPPTPTSPPMTPADVPADMHEIFSHRLPDELYFHLFRGLISPLLLNALTSGLWTEQAPLCGGESEEYKRFLKDIMTEHAQSPRCTALALLSSALNVYWQKKPVNAVYYFDPTNVHPIPHIGAAAQKTLERLLQWNVPSLVIEEELRRQKSSTIDLRLCLGAVADGPTWAARTRVSKNPAKLLDKKDEIVANTLWRFLELRGFISSTHLPTANGKALYSALQQSRINDKFQEPLYLAIELVRAGVLHSGKFGSRNWSGGPGLGGESDKANAMLVMRVLSIVPLNFKTEPWSGPMSRSLLVFNSFLSTLSRSLRALLEATTVNLLLREDARRHREDYLEIALSLPFRSDTNTAMGVLWKGWCDACSHVGHATGLGTREDLGGFVPRQGLSEEQVAQHRADLEGVKQDVSGMLEGAFGNVRDVRNELARGVRFWDTVMVAIRVLNQDPKVLPPEMFTQFESANRWLQPFRP